MPLTYYVADDSKVYAVRLSADDIAAQPTAPSPHQSVEKLRAKVSKSNHAYGLSPRKVTFARSVGTPPDTAEKFKQLTVLQASDVATLQDEPFTYGGHTWSYVGYLPERYR